MIAKLSPTIVLKNEADHIMWKCEEDISFMQAVFEQNLIAESVIDRTEVEYGQKIGIVGKLFGCWHKRLGRPITSQRSTYRACLECGARRNFNTEEYKTSGPFYFPPSVKSDYFR